MSDKTKAVIVIVVLILISIIYYNSKTTLSSDYKKYQILKVYQNENSRIIAVVESKQKGYLNIDITDATLDKNVEDLSTAVLYWGDPSKHNNDPHKFLIIKKK